MREQRFAASLARELAVAERSGTFVPRPESRDRLGRFLRVPLARVGAAGHPALPVRRHLTTRERAYYVVFTPRRVTLDTLVHVAGRRWAIEHGFETSKQDVDLSVPEIQHQLARLILHQIPPDPHHVIARSRW